jgi:alkaline phosphatase D
MRSQDGGDGQRRLGSGGTGALFPPETGKGQPHIETNRIPGVLLISGDRHGARVFRIPRPSGFTFYEFEPASLGGRGGPAATSPEWKDVQLFGISGKYAFGEFTVDGTLSDPEVTFRLIRETGDILYELKLKRSQLTPPKPGPAKTGS